MTLKSVDRDPWIDNLKAIGIILVIIGHLYYSPVIKPIYSFHMPLFFFISGYLFNFKKYENFRIFLQTKFKSILIPYFYLSLITYLFWLFVGRFFGADADSDINLTKPFFGIFYSNSVNEWLLPNKPMWFLTCLFATEVLYYAFSKLFKSSVSLTIVLAFFAFIGYIQIEYIGLKLPWTIEILPISVVFYGVGNLVRKIDSPPINKYFLILAGILLIGINVFVSDLNVRPDMADGTFGLFAIYYTAAFTGIAGIAFVTKILPHNRMLSFVGQNTLVIMALHSILISLLKGVQVFVLKIPLEELTDSLFLNLIYLVSILLFITPVIFIINAYFPFLLGKARPKLKVVAEPASI